MGTTHGFSFLSLPNKPASMLWKALSYRLFNITGRVFTMFDRYLRCLQRFLNSLKCWINSVRLSFCSPHVHRFSVIATIYLLQSFLPSVNPKFSLRLNLTHTHKTHASYVVCITCICTIVSLLHLHMRNRVYAHNFVKVVFIICLPMCLHMYTVRKPFENIIHVCFRIFICHFERMDVRTVIKNSNVIAAERLIEKKKGRHFRK